MPKATFPPSIAVKQRLLYSQPLPPADLATLGDAYADRGLWHDALEFYEGAKDAGRLENVCREAIQGADLVLYLNARKAMGLGADQGDLGRLRERALAAGKEATAKKVELLLIPGR